MFIRWLDKYNFQTGPIPLLLSTIYIAASAAIVEYLTGLPFWRTLLGAVLVASLISGLLAVAGLVLMRRASQRQRLPAEILFAGWLLLLGCVLPLTYLNTDNNLEAWPFAGFIGISIGGLGLMMADFIKKLPVDLNDYALAAGLATLALLLLAG